MRLAGEVIGKLTKTGTWSIIYLYVPLGRAGDIVKGGKNANAVCCTCVWF